MSDPHSRSVPATMIVLGLAAVAFASCTSPSPTIAPDALLRLPGSWPAHPAPAAGEEAMRQQCSAGVGPVAATDDRGFGFVFVVMGDPQNLGTCDLQASGDSFTVQGGGTSHSEPVPADAFQVVENGIGPAWTPERQASADPLYAYRDLIGVAPVGADRVRAVVGDRVIDATMAGRLFIVAWPVDEKASLVVAFAADGTELGRITGDALHSPDSYRSN